MYKNLIKIFNLKFLVPVLSIFFFITTLVIGMVLVTRPSVVSHFAPNLGINFVQLCLFLSYSLFCISYLFLITTEKSKLKNPAIRLILLASALIILVNYFVEGLEQIYYHNFVYSRFHIYPPFLSNLANLQIVIISFTIVWFLKDVAIKNKKIFTLVLDNKVLLVKLILLILFGSSLLGATKTIFIEAFNIKKTAEKQVDFANKAIDLGDFTYAMDFIHKNTEQDSVILIPAQSEDFPLIGNQVLVRYFLFPRTLVSPGKVGLFFKDNSLKDCNLYSILAVGSGLKKITYPDFEIQTDKIIIFTNDRKTYEVETKKYTKDVAKNFGEFQVGLIKYKKCSI